MRAPQDGIVLCFTSGKGGSGKTILAASLASMIVQSGLRAVLIDTDFSTRGLSFFALGSLIVSENLVIPWESCIADVLQRETGNDTIQTLADKMRPLTLKRGGKQSDWDIFLPNSSFSAGGLPPDFLLGGSGFGGDMETLESKFFDLLDRLLPRLRREYDYIIVDTRGGSDFSSKTPVWCSQEPSP